MVLPTYVTINGLRLPNFKKETMEESMRYKPVEGDLFLVTYPKCGTTWLHQIVYLILTGGKPCTDPTEFHQRVPFIEMMGNRSFSNLIKPGALKTHLTMDTIPLSTKAKYIYCCRNPKDCCVSFYDHTKTVPNYKFQDGTFDEYFEIFMKGEVNYNDYFAHVRSWYDIRNSPNVLFINYEDVNKDSKTMIKRIATFMGNQYSQTIEQNPKILEDIVYHSRFDVMKDKINDLMRYMVPYGVPPRVPVQFVRKGKTGGWRDMMTKEQSNRLDQKIEKTLGDTDLPELWRKYQCI